MLLASQLSHRSNKNMAEATVSVLIDLLLSIIQQETVQEIRLPVGHRKEITHLTATLNTIKQVLQDAEEKQVTNNAAKVWVEELQDVVHDAEDVIDEWYTKTLISQRTDKVDARGSKKVFSYLFAPCSCSRPVSVIHGIVNRIARIRRKLEVISREKDQLNLIESRTNEETRIITCSLFDEPKIQGRDVAISIIASKLLDDTNSETITVIVGIGGIGKTALAQVVFKDVNVMAAFELRTWVCLSEPFDLHRVAMEIILQASGEQPDDYGWDDLRVHLYKSVRGKRVLLVPDNCWIEDDEKWNLLELCLDGSAVGSRILITACSDEFLKMIGSVYIYRLGRLLDEDSWSLFKERALFGRSEEEIQRFEVIGKEVVNKCDGLPLAVKMLASLLKFKRTKQEWRSILQSEIWDTQTPEKGYLAAVSLSYRALPSHLKQCFLYCAIIPKGALISADRLVRSWMAQGFLGSDGRKELEVLGKEFFYELAMHSFFQDLKEDGEGNIIACKMHNAVHDFSQTLTTECSKIRHVNAWNMGTPMSRNLRTLVIQLSGVGLVQLFRQYTCLRALELSCSDFEELPREIGGLIHLRFLDLSNTPLKDLPETVSELYNLQTLNLNHCRYLCKLPERIGELSNLRHLEIDGTYKLSSIPAGIGRLSCIRTLCKFIISDAIGRCTIKELRSLNYLTGYLEIIGLRQVENERDAEMAKLQDKTCLRSLKLDFRCFVQENDDVGEDNVRMNGVLECLKPHKNLEQMWIIGYTGSVFPSWTSVLSNIVTLKLFRCGQCVQLPALGMLESLENLTIEKLEAVKYIGSEFYGVGSVAFPNLKKLRFVDMEEWKDWQFPFSKYKKIMPRLSELTLRSCAKLVRLPSIGKLEALEKLFICELSSVNHIGMDEDVSAEEEIYLPSLQDLKFVDMEDWEEWNLPFDKGKQIMPHLRRLELRCCLKLKVMPALGELQSLETLKLQELKALRNLGPDLLTVSFGGFGNERLIFPALTCLTLVSLPEWDEQPTSTNTAMPSLRMLEIAWCKKLKLLPCYMFSRTLTSLSLRDCPSLTGMQPSLPCQLEELILDGDVGVFSELLPVKDSSYLNLVYLAIHSSPCRSLPRGLEQLTSLQELHFFFCKTLDFKLEELEHFASLCKLEIIDCPTLTEHCRDEWSILSHVPDIAVDVDLEAEEKIC